MGQARAQIEARYTPGEYLEFERDAAERHEFLDGRVYMMAGESLSHSRICTNLSGEVRTKLKGKPCEPLSPNMKVRTSNASLFAYPNLTIVCGEPEFHDAKTDVLTNPKVIFEVLSPSTENYDRTVKFQRYRMGNETLTDYVLVSRAVLTLNIFGNRQMAIGHIEALATCMTISLLKASKYRSAFRRYMTEWSLNRRPKYKMNGRNRGKICPDREQTRNNLFARAAQVI